jgi:hypothetical protein
MSAVHCHFRLLLALSLSLFLCRLAAAQGLPPAVEAALQRAKLPADALTLHLGLPLRRVDNLVLEGLARVAATPPLLLGAGAPGSGVHGF